MVRVLAVIVAAVVLVVGGALLWNGRSPEGLTVPEVVAALGNQTGDPAERAMRTRIDALGFPQPEGWRAVSGGVVTLKGRRVGTVNYRRSGEQVSYTIVSGTARVENDSFATVFERRRYRVIQEGSPERSLLAFEREGRTVLVRGSERQTRGIGAFIARR